MFSEKKVIPFEVFPFSRFYRKFLSHLFTLTSARVFTILPRKNVEDLKDGGRFPKRLSMQSVSFLIGSVSGRFFGNPMHYSCDAAKCNVKSISNKSYALLVRHTPTGKLKFASLGR